MSLKAYIGLTLGVDVTVEELKAVSGATKVRVIKPGTAVTMDYVITRLNVNVDNLYVIKSLSWG